MNYSKLLYFYIQDTCRVEKRTN